jgi:hypothetical protein
MRWRGEIQSYTRHESVRWIYVAACKGGGMRGLLCTNSLPVNQSRVPDVLVVGAEAQSLAITSLLTSHFS